MTDSNPAENWLPAPGYGGAYEVSDQGRVRTYKPGRVGRILKPYNDRDYQVVQLWQHARCTTIGIHRLVLLTFVGEPPHERDHACHYDGDRTNNHLGNLRWGTAEENAADMRRHNRHRNGRKTHCKRGHEFTEENTRWQKGDRRACRTCDRDYAKTYVRPSQRAVS